MVKQRLRFSDPTRWFLEWSLLHKFCSELGGEKEGGLRCTTLVTEADSLYCARQRLVNLQWMEGERIKNDTYLRIMYTPAGIVFINKSRTE